MARPPENDNIRSEFSRFLAVAQERGWADLKVMFGFAWANYVYENDWLEEVISPDELHARVKVCGEEQ